MALLLKEGGRRYDYNITGDLISVTNALGQPVTYGNYNGLGLPGTVTDATLVSTQLVYDARGRTTSSKRTIAGVMRETIFVYDAMGNVAKVTYPDGSIVEHAYDAVGRLIRTTRGPNDKQEYVYNLLSNITSHTKTQREPYIYCRPMGGGEPCEEVIRYRDTTYFSKTWDRDTLGRVLAEKGNNLQNVRYKYDNNGNVWTMTDSLNRVTTYEYNPHDQLKAVIDPLNRRTDYTYDNAGRLDTVKDFKGQFTSYRYDGLDNLIDLSSPDTGPTSFTYAYNETGLRRTMLRADGILTTYDHDVLGRLKTATAGGQAQALTYDNCSYGTGRLCRLDDASGSTAYAYNEPGLLANQTSTINGVNYSVGWAYDKLDRMTTVTYPGGNQALYEYDAPQQVLAAVKTVIGGVTRTVGSGMAYYPFGPRSKWTYGNGLQRTLTFDSDYRLKQVLTSGIQNLSYAYNANNELTKLSHGLNANLTQTYAYDIHSRLETITAGVGNQSIGFDANGNRDLHTWGGLSDDYVIDPYSNRISSVLGARPRGLGYDVLGNLKNDTGWRGNSTYAYDPFNRVQSITKDGITTQYLNNILNQRVRKSGAGGTYNYIYGPSGEL